MYLRDMLATLGRRWYVLVVGVLGTVAMCAWVVQQVPPNQVSTASVLLLPPTSAVDTGGNPFLALTGLEQPGDILTKYLSSDDARQQLLEGASPSADYTIGLDPSTSGPILLVTADDSTASGSVALLDKVVAAVPASLTLLQTQVSVPVPAQVRSMVIAQDSVPTPKRTPTVRALVAAVGAGGVVTVFACALLDVAVRRSRDRRAARRERPGKERPGKERRERRPGERGPHAARLGRERARAERASTPPQVQERERQGRQPRPSEPRPPRGPGLATSGDEAADTDAAQRARRLAEAVVGSHRGTEDPDEP